MFTLLSLNFGATSEQQRPNTTQNRGIIRDQKTKPGTTKGNPVRSAKPPSPVQIRAAPPFSLRDSRDRVSVCARGRFLVAPKSPRIRSELRRATSVKHSSARSCQCAISARDEVQRTSSTSGLARSLLLGASPSGGCWRGDRPARRPSCHRRRLRPVLEALVRRVAVDPARSASSAKREHRVRASDRQVADLALPRAPPAPPKTSVRE
jgi:hypothetical protein